MHTIFGGYYTEVTPVPIPNTEVKLCSAYDTWREAARESWSLPEQTKKEQIQIVSVLFLWRDKSFRICDMSYRHDIPAVRYTLRA